MLRLHRVALAALVLVATTACEKGGPQDILADLPGSRVRFFNLAVGAPNVNFWANDRKLTAINSTTGQESTLGTAYGSAGSSSLYSAMQPGQYTFTGRISAATDKDLPIATASATLDAGKAYSFYISGVYDPVAKRADSFFVEDQIPARFDFSIGIVRFVNASASARPLVLVARNTTTGAETAIGAAVAYRSAGTFVTLQPGVYDMSLRETPTSTAVITRTAVPVGAGRVFTVSLRGDMTLSPTGTAATRPILDVFFNI